MTVSSQVGQICAIDSVICSSWRIGPSSFPWFRCTFVVFSPITRKGSTALELGVKSMGIRICVRLSLLISHIGHVFSAVAYCRKELQHETAAHGASTAWDEFSDVHSQMDATMVWAVREHAQLHVGHEHTNAQPTKGQTTTHISHPEPSHFTDEVSNRPTLHAKTCYLLAVL